MVQRRFNKNQAHQTLYAKAQGRKLCMIHHPWSVRDSMQGGGRRRTPTLALPVARTYLLIVCVRANLYHVSNTEKRSIVHVNSDNLEPAADPSRVLTTIRPPSRTRSASVAQPKSISVGPLPPQILPMPSLGVLLSHTGRQPHHPSSRRDLHRLIRTRKIQA